MKLYFPLSLLLIWMLSSCNPTATSSPANPSNQQQVQPFPNPPAEGFNEADSDPYAITLADEVMKAMGGRMAWDNTRYIKWNFFGSRSLTWDKWQGRARIESHQSDFKAIVNLNDLSGKVWKDGAEMTDADSLKKYLGRANSIWINDSYWLVMPFKLKDSGLTIKHLGADTTQAGEMADIVELTFEGVGDTPQNKYHVYISQAEKLVKQWTFFRSADQAESNFITPWQGYKKYGNILLCGDRGRGQLTDIEVLKEMPEEVFTDW